MRHRSLVIACFVLSAVYSFNVGATEFSLKGLTVGISESQLTKNSPMTRCVKEADASHGYDATCTNVGALPSRFATYAGYEVKSWNALLTDGRVVCYLVIFSGSHQPSLVASLDDGFGAHEEVPNPRAALRWNSEAQFLSVGHDAENNTMVTLWDKKAFQRVIEVRKKVVESDM